MTARRNTMLRIRCNAHEHILVVCHGNIYRSPFVAAMLRQRLSSTLEIRSAGFHSIIGRPSPAAHVAMAARLGVNLESHRSQIVTSIDMSWADTIVLMDGRNWQELRRLGADPNKLVWLGAMDGKPEIPDPYGMPDIEAWDVVQRLHRCTEALVAAIDAQGRLLP